MGYNFTSREYDGVVKASFATSGGDGSIINWYRHNSFTESDNPQSLEKDNCQSSYWEIINRYGEISRFRAYRTDMNTFMRKGLNPHAEVVERDQKATAADLSGGSISAFSDGTDQHMINAMQRQP